MISAKDAYALAAPKLDEYRSFLDSRIREAAERGMTSITVREDPYNNWLRNETTLDDMDARRCIRELRDLGYAIEQLYRTDVQSVDVGLIIDWSKK